MRQMSPPRFWEQFPARGVVRRPQEDLWAQLTPDTHQTVSHHSPMFRGRRCLSSQEIEQLEIEQKKVEVKRMLARNRRSIVTALAPNPRLGAWKLRMPTDMTFPVEFNLSPGRQRSPRTSSWCASGH